MHLLYAASSSYKEVFGSSGHMEKMLIQHFLTHSLCENIRGGGESASPHQPHYTYVVERHA